MTRMTEEELAALPAMCIIEKDGHYLAKLADGRGPFLDLDTLNEWWASMLIHAELVSIPTKLLPTAGHMAWMMEDRLGPRVGDSAYTFVAVDIASVWS